MRSALLVLFASVPLVACGGGDSAGSDGGPGANPCGFGSDDYLPYQAGFTWTYRLTDLGTGARTTKEQRVEPEMQHEQFGAVLVQVTGKDSGETVSLMRAEAGRVLRFQQDDHDATGAVERTTVYDPAQIRIDQTAERTAVGATWDESYTETVTEPGVAPVEVATVDTWEVLGVDVACESPLGSFECLHLRRTRSQGGVAQKEFHFAAGVGKVREVGSNQLEELTACAAE